MCNSASFLIRLAVFALILEQTTSTCKKYIHSVTSIPWAATRWWRLLCKQIICCLVIPESI
jgi:hypothetical protein